MCISIHAFHVYKRLTPFLLRRKVRLRRNDENLVLTILYQNFTVVCPCVQDSSKFSQISCIVGEPSSPGRQVLVHEDSTFVGARLQFVALSECFVSATFALEFHEHGARAICLCRLVLHSDSVTPNDIVGLERWRDTHLLVDNVNYCVV